MAVVITIDNAKIHHWTVNVEGQFVEVFYHWLDSTGEPFGTMEQIVLWVTIPDPVDGPEGPVPNPDNWYQLPVAYQQVLTDLTADAMQVILARIGE